MFSNLFKKAKKNISLENLPIHVAIIMDGNGRWAKKRALPRVFGHRQGVKTVKKIVRRASDLGIKYLTLYTFSTENWKRPVEEVDFLMNLFVDTLEKDFKELYDEGVKLDFIGELDKLPDKVRETLEKTKENSRNNRGLNLILAINYGSRNEIVSTVKYISQKVNDNEILIDDIDEELISKSLFTSGIPDPDLLIRTANEHRISNYLLWQIAYSELYFINEYWPDFTNELFEKALLDYKKRHRRFGGL